MAKCGKVEIRLKILLPIFHSFKDRMRKLKTLYMILKNINQTTSTIFGDLSTHILYFTNHTQIECCYILNWLETVLWVKTETEMSMIQPWWKKICTCVEFYYKPVLMFCWCNLNDPYNNIFNIHACVLCPRKHEENYPLQLNFGFIAWQIPPSGPDWCCRLCVLKVCSRSWEMC